MRRKGYAWLLAATLVIGAAGACRQDMHDQAKYEPLEASPFFGDGLSARPLMAGTIARGHLDDDSLLYTGKIDGEFADVFPFPVTRQVLERGRERFDIYCSPCHGQAGDGQGIIVQRGFKPPPSYHIQRLIDQPPGYFFDVMTNGFGVMYSYAGRVKPADRWAIAAYIRALQFSQRAPVDQLSDDDLRQIREARR